MKNALKQQLREKAKNHTITIGVLSVKNNMTGKQLIHGSLNLEALVNKMKFQLNAGQFANSQLQKDWKELGSEAFSFEFIYNIEPLENSFINFRKEILKAEKILVSEIKTELY
ncbi:GIY-YIG nuclease family protein [Chryseobacterium sp. RG1]|uniref:GIY-YIG nuclease family protein n=1 Tax=Chryseobacterium tagetis TaxID=2801334 RepID=A0ABS8A3T8_9FLAO|nr:GIY-YIG nuclease family protein [Chryseobacterium tagetis]MCA6068647.1 GIY-YIG nuclease family protein [Chryseobacterium tagetis]